MDNHHLQHTDIDSGDDHSEHVLHLDGFQSDFTRHLDLMGMGYLMASNHGVSMAVKSSRLTPEVLGAETDLWWPESGLKIKATALEAVYSRFRAQLGVGAIECDFKGVSNGFSVVFLPDDFDDNIFKLVCEAHAVDCISSEQEVLRLVAGGASNTEVARQLGLSARTAGNHRYNAMRKLDIHNVTDLVAFAIKHGFRKAD